MLTEKERKALLNIARQTIEEYVREGKKPAFEVTEPALKEKRGVFVTLHEAGRLRGCIGHVMPIDELYRDVSRIAIESATADPRFPPVKAEELKEIEIEISVLTVPERIKSIEEMELGRDGVIIKRGMRQGVFLPQVATETGWSKEEFLSHLSQDKAGLEAEAWKDKDTEIFTFQAEVFSEERKEKNNTGRR
ncbi:AmmeMemoRadiSam system protein A [candidate division NPL-UPA2 bacterium]|nr:AmmeMemoRadiSam system protein A [candidate division NPL-UPA2 bacterium]